MCMIKIFIGGGAGMVNGEGGNSERCLKWGGGGHKKLFVGRGGTEGTTTPAPLPKILTVHHPMGCIRMSLSQFLKN